jgi:hypothetical protein
MNTKRFIPLCVAAALLVGCGPRDVPKAEDASTGEPGDTSTTPGGTAGEMTPPPDTSTNPATPPPAEPPPPEPAPGEQSPSTPPQ